MGRQIQLLLDTHALFWWLQDDRRLSAAARDAVDGMDNVVFVSAISALELGIKHRIGKLPDGNEIVDKYEMLIRQNGFVLLDVTSAHALRAGLYPGTHRDPFDRILAAQSELTGAFLVTRDPAIAQFPCKTLW